MADELIVTLLAEEGKKFKDTGEAIASHGRCLVFLPKGAVPGERVRVRLQEIKEDSRGRMMYRGLPAPIKYSDRWKDNGDGTASRVTIATNWLFKETEEGVVETRALGKREGAPAVKQDRRIVWGPDLATSSIEAVKVRVFSLESEQVSGGALVWIKTGEREERDSPERLPILRVKVWAGDFDAKKLEAAYSDTWTLTADCYYTDLDLVRENTVWSKLPAWLEAEVQAQYPICACGRKRIAQTPDGYSKCEQCRKEEVCVRCHKKSTVKNLGGRLVCEKCQPYEGAEQMIETNLPRERREAIAAEAKLLCTGQALPQEAGEAILKATLDHLSSGWRKDNLLQTWSGYGWYYFCNEGVFATKLAPAALQILQFLPLASGNGLVEMTAWLVGGAKAQNSDFYLRTQVKGESGVSLPQITENLVKQLKVAEFLRGSEADRIAALAGYRNLVSKLGEESREVKAVAEILQEEKQDYAKALAKIREAEDLLATAERGEVLLNFGGHFRHMGNNDQCDVWVIGPDGQEVESEIDYRKRYSSEGNKTWKVVRPDCLALRWSRGQGSGQFGEDWQVVKLPINGLTEAQREAARRIEPHERFSGPGSGFDLSQVGMNACSASRDLGYDRFWVSSFGADPVPCDENGEPINPEALRMKQLQEASQHYEANLAYAKEQVASGNWLRLKFGRGKHPKTGEVQWEAGTKHQKFVLDRFTGYEPVEGEAYFCSLGKFLVNSPSFQLQIVHLEQPFPEDAPPKVESSQDQTGGQLTPDMIAALKKKWGA